jgi:hypothetical protein
MTKKNNDQINASKMFVRATINEFREKYPNLNLKSLRPTFPASLQNVKLSEKEIAQIGLHPVVLSTICGTTFGDSSLTVQKNYANARLTYRHSTRQTEWVLWKTLCVFQDFVTDNSVLFQMPDGYQAEATKVDGFLSWQEEENLGKFKVSTMVDEKLTQLRDIIAPNNKKTIMRSWLNHMNNYFLMTLWLDDGGLTGEGGRQGVISTGTMPLDQAEVLADYLKTVWDVDCEARYVTEKKMKNNQYPSRIFIKDQANLMKLLRIIAPVIPVKSMLYKVCFFPTDVSLQQRWASELKQLVRPEWHDTLDIIFSYKKLKSIQKKI